MNPTTPINIIIRLRTIEATGLFSAISEIIIIICYLLIDEFENGLHYSIQEEVWEKLFKIAKELDIQVFATTHSEDTVKAFCKISVADKEVNGKLISLGRSAAIADNGKILADVYDEETLKILIQSGMEVR